jgi:hypothetical protein
VQFEIQTASELQLETKAKEVAGIMVEVVMMVLPARWISLAEKSTRERPIRNKRNKIKISKI